MVNLTFQNYKEVLDYLYRFTPAYHKIGSKAFKPGLEKTYQLDEYFRYPHKNYITIHVGGTNGKGTVSHTLAAILQQAGYKVGLYTSPHLIDFVERIKVNSINAPHSFVTDFVQKHHSIIPKIEPSFFEFTTFMAFEYFKEQEVDIAIIEVGMGGRLDTTNIIQPILSIITNVSFDHQMFLGDSLPQIAYEKAGIIKKDTPVVIGEYHPETYPIFLQKAQEMDAPLYFAQKNYEWFVIQRNWQYQILKDLKSNQIFKTDLIGNYQLKNLKTILQSIDLLKVHLKNVTEKIVYEAIKKVKKITGLRGRMEFLSIQGMNFLLDVAHNLAGIQELVDYIQNFSLNQIHFIVGFVNDKDIHEILELFPKKAQFYFLKPNVERGFDAHELKIIAQKKGINGNSYSDFRSLLREISSRYSNQDLIIVCGSCFLVGDFLNFIKTIYEL